MGSIIMEVWFRSFSFLRGWFEGSMLIFQGVPFWLTLIHLHSFLAARGSWSKRCRRREGAVYRAQGENPKGSNWVHCLKGSFYPIGSMYSIRIYLYMNGWFSWVNIRTSPMDPVWYVCNRFNALRLAFWPDEKSTDIGHNPIQMHPNMYMYIFIYAPEVWK